MVAEPLPAIVARVIDDDSQSANTDGAKAVKGVGDKESSGDRHHRFANAIPVRPQAAPIAGGDDTSLEDRTRRYGRHINIFMRSRSSLTAARAGGSADAGASAAWTSRGAIQMKPMPVRRAPSRSRRNESPTNTVVS